jgi:hypothetical protein
VKFVLDGYPPSIKRDFVTNINGALQKKEYWHMPERPITYKDVKEFLEINPNCCVFTMRTEEGRRPSFVDRITGYVATYVIVKFKVIYLDENNVESYAESGEIVAVKNCGKSWEGF